MLGEPLRLIVTVSFLGMMRFVPMEGLIRTREPKLLETEAEFIQATPDFAPRWPGCQYNTAVERENYLIRSCFAYAAENFEWSDGIYDYIKEGTVYFEAVVQADGTLTNILILHCFHPAAFDKALRVVKSIPKMTPAVHNGVAVRSRVILPMIFKKPISK